MFFPVTLLRHVFAVRDPADAALAAALRHAFRARSTASRPRARSSARSARPSSSFRRSARARSRYSLGAAGIVCGLVLLALPRLERAPRGAGDAAGGALIACGARRPRAPRRLIDESVRADMLKRADGRIAHIETEYNDIFITKRRSELTMSFQLKGWDYTEIGHQPARPRRPAAALHAGHDGGARLSGEPKKILMIGLGGGSISTYLGRYMPEVAIDTVEIDPGVIRPRRQYFGIRETPRVRYLDGDGRVFLNRNKERYDLILVDAYHGGYVPFHLLTREFYALVKQRLAPGGAAAFNVHDGTKLYASTVQDAERGVPEASISIRRARRGDRDRDRRAGAGQGRRSARAPRRCRSATASAIRCRSCSSGA